MQAKQLFLDIRFWIVSFFTIRLVGITNAPLERSHNWRQAFTNTVARNLSETDFNLLYPKVDMAGDLTGIIGSEFPLLNGLIAVCNIVSGHSHWYGRLINLIVSSIGTFYFYKSVKSAWNKQIAFNATLVFLSSIWFAFSRKIMPDTFSISLMLIGVWFAIQHLQQGKLKHLVLFFLFTTFGILVKLPAIVILSVFTIPVLSKSFELKNRIKLIITGTVSFSIGCLWYFLWVPHLVKTYKFKLYFPKGIMQGIQEIKQYIPELLEKFYFDALSSYIAFAFFLGGIVFLIKLKQKNTLITFAIFSTIFGVFIIKTGAVFPLHNYYIIPFTPVMAIIVGWFISQLPKTISVYVLALILIEGIANQQHDFFLKTEDLYPLELESMLDEVSEKDEKIIINGGKSFKPMYFAHRKGWSIASEDLNNPKLEALYKKGARYLIIDKHIMNKKFSLKVLKENSDFTIYKL
jgi:hypothetical protein